jgi:hypothetical protein
MRAAVLAVALLLAAGAPAQAGMALSLLAPPPGVLRLYLELIAGRTVSLSCVR